MSDSLPGLAQVIPARRIPIPAFAKSSSSSLQLSFSSVPQELFHLPWKDLQSGEGLLWLLAQEKVQGHQASRASPWTLYFLIGGRQEKDAPTDWAVMLKVGEVWKNMFLVLESPTRTSCSTSLAAGPEHFLLFINP